MRFTSTFLPVLGFAAEIASAAYVLQDDYPASSFFDMFNFFTEADPTHGYVTYVDRATAEGAGLISASNSSVYMGVDHTNIATTGRQSVRLTSNQAYNKGLFILDLAHMPNGVCGSWPAFWILGPDWPNGGEVDIIEGVHDQTNNQMALHTSDGCSIDGLDMSGNLLTSNCYVSAEGQDTNAGCGIQAPTSDTYGVGFNGVGGGVYATEWTSEAINIWFFPRASIPADISAGTPDPSIWGLPVARYAGNCDIDSHFHDMQIIFDITFCGDWAGNVWSTSTCASRASSCEDFVANQPAEFTEAYWTVNSLRVYQESEVAWKRAAEEYMIPRRSLRGRRARRAL